MDDYPLLSKEESKEVLELYIADELASGVDPDVLSHDELPNHLFVVYYLNRKRKPKCFGE